MTTKHFLALGLSLVIFIGFYFIGDIRMPKQDSINKERNEVTKGINASPFIEQAKAAFPESKIAYFNLQEQNLRETTSDSQKIVIYKDLASNWYQANHPEISGYYASQIAELTKAESAWSIAGTTFLIGLKKSESLEIRDFCLTNAVTAFENAISINPGNTDNRINLASCYVEKAPENEPMKGILMLLDLNKKQPENVAVIVTLARLGIKTNQLEKAIARLEKALSIDPNHKEAICLIAEAYTKIGNKEKADYFLSQCSK